MKITLSSCLVFKNFSNIKHKQPVNVNYFNLISLYRRVHDCLNSLKTAKFKIRPRSKRAPFEPIINLTKKPHKDLNIKKSH